MNFLNEYNLSAIMAARNFLPDHNIGPRETEMNLKF
jgi:hypothetical protein